MGPINLTIHFVSRRAGTDSLPVVGGVFRYGDVRFTRFASSPGAPEPQFVTKISADPYLAVAETIMLACIVASAVVIAKPTIFRFSVPPDHS